MELIADIGRRIGGGRNAPNLAFLLLMLALMVAPMLARRVRSPSMVAVVLLGMVLGPHVLGILAPEQIALPAFGALGLLYLMFSAGLELDPDELQRNQRTAIAFALLSFAVPLVLGLTGAKLVGYTWAAAILMGANWASHTLVTYPILRELGLARERAVSTVVGATALTDTSALFVLAAVSVGVRRTESFALEATETVVGLTVLVAWSLIALPRVGRWFFARAGPDEAQRLVFALAALLLGAILAEAAAINGIVGAFFAGLGLGRSIPVRSPLMDRIQFLGKSLLIPIFLVSVGVLLDPDVLVRPKTVLTALVFLVAVLGGKSIAAIVVGRRRRFTRAEIGVMAALSGSQAAATLATTLVGQQLGLFDATAVNAVLVVILVTLVVTPPTASVFGRRLVAERGAGHAVEALGRAVMVHVTGEASRPLLHLAAEIAARDNGMVTAVSLAREHAPAPELAAKRDLSRRAAEWLAREGLESQSIFRVSRSVPAGLEQTVESEDATLLVTEWEPGPEAEAEADDDARVSIPRLLVPGAVEPFHRVVLLAHDTTDPGASLDLRLATELSTHLSRGMSICVVAVRRAEPLDDIGIPARHVERIATADPLAWARDNLRGTDLVVLPGTRAFRDARRRLPSSLRRVVIALARHRPADA